MKSKSKPQSRAGTALPPYSAKQLCSAWELDSTSFAWDNRWGMPLEAAAVGAFAGDDVMRPPTSTIFQQARRWYRLHAFIRTVIQLKLGFFNSGLLGERLVAVNPKKPDGEKELEVHPGIRAVNTKDDERIAKWKRENAEEIARVVIDVWLSFLLQRNVVCLWSKGTRAILYPPEGVTYSDLFGMETLTIRHGLKDEQIDGLPGLTKAERDILKSNRNLKLTHESKIFSFKILKEESVGMGFGWPDLVTLFHVCSLNESLLVGDRQLADACRSVYEQHLLGHEIKSGNHAGSPAHFMKKPRAEAVKKEIQSKKGHIQLATNFDHKILIGAGRPLPEQYDTKRYAQIAEQMAVWGLPFAQMLNGQINPYLMTLARQMGDVDRKRVRPYLASILREALHAPGPVTVQWDELLLGQSHDAGPAEERAASRADFAGEFPAVDVGESDGGEAGEGTRCGAAKGIAGAGV
jgi:hypothetical protein